MTCMAQAFVCQREKLRVRVSALPTHTLASGKEAHVKAHVLTLVEKSWAINQDLVQYILKWLRILNFVIFGQ